MRYEIPMLSREVAVQEHSSIWRRPTVSWMLYDLANTMFVFAIQTFYFPRWVVTEAGGNDALLSYAITIPMLVMLVAAPLLGALSDQMPRRMPFLVTTTVLCVIFTLLLGTGGLLPSLIFFGLANAFFHAGQIFYDALLPEVSSKKNRGRVSGYGIGIGYFGSFIMLGVGVLFLASGYGHVSIFRATALLFLLVALPCFLFVRERPRPNTQSFSRATLVEAFRSVGQTASRLGEYPGLGRFLVARALYTDVSNTLYFFLAIYVQMELGFSEQMVTAVGGIAIVAAILGGFLWGRVLEWLGPKRTLNLVLFTWMAGMLLGVLVPLLNLPAALFYLVAVISGVALSGTWSADRMLLLQMAPPHYLGQFYGLYAMVGRFGQLIGPLLWGFIAVTLGLGRPIALLSLLFITVIAWIILQPVPDASTSGGRQSGYESAAAGEQ